VPVEPDAAAGVQHQHPIGLAQRGKTVGDDERGAANHQLVDRALHFLFRDGVERRGRLVEQQDRGVLQQRSRDRQPLPLPARHLATANADLGFISAGQGHDVFVDVGGAGGLLHLDGRRAGPAEANVVLCGRRKQERLLGHEGDLVVDIVQLQLAGIAPIEANGPLGRVIEPHQQTHQRGLATP